MARRGAPAEKGVTGAAFAEGSETTLVGDSTDIEENAGEEDAEEVERRDEPATEDAADDVEKDDVEGGAVDAILMLPWLLRWLLR